MEKIFAKIGAENRVYKIEIDFAVLMNKDSLMMWKIKCLGLFNVPLPLFKEREKEGEVKEGE